MFYVYGFDLLDKIWVVSIVVVLVVVCLFGCVVILLSSPRVFPLCVLVTENASPA